MQRYGLCGNVFGLTFRVSLCSFLASLGWFSAMSMQCMPIVKTLGQVQIIFSMLISAYFFKEKLARAEHLGIVLVVIAAFFSDLGLKSDLYTASCHSFVMTLTIQNVM